MSFESKYDNAVPITRDIFWTGFFDNESSLHCNPYLLDDGEDVVVIDPGSIPHFPIVMRKILDLVKPNQITYIIAGHQDPDVCGNLSVMEDIIDNKTLQIVAHSGTIRLIRHYGIGSNFYYVDDNDYKLTLKSGRILDFIYTAYLHSPGAIATYDRKTQSLFSCDIFGALSEDRWDLFAGDDYPEIMTEWHQMIMPSNAILAECMTRFEKMDIKRILPQHGSVIEGRELVKKAIEYLKTLPCGIDLKTS